MELAETATRLRWKKSRGPEALSADIENCKGYSFVRSSLKGSRQSSFYFILWIFFDLHSWLIFWQIHCNLLIFYNVIYQFDNVIILFILKVLIGYFILSSFVCFALIILLLCLYSKYRLVIWFYVWFWYICVDGINWRFYIDSYFYCIHDLWCWSTFCIIFSNTNQ